MSIYSLYTILVVLSRRNGYCVWFFVDLSGRILLSHSYANTMNTDMNPEEKSIHEQFVQLGTAAKEAVRKCALMLPEIMRRGIWKKKGYESIHEYARVFAGMSSAAVDEALRVLNKNPR